MEKTFVSNQYFYEPQHHVPYSFGVSSSEKRICDYIKKLEKDALAKVHANNAKDDPFVKKFDPTTVAYILDSKCVYGNGHSSLLFIDRQGAGIFYNTSDLRDFVGAIKGDPVGFVIDRRVLSKNEVSYLLNSGTFLSDLNGSGLMKYDKYIALPLDTYMEGKIALNKADEIYQNPGFYNLYERNCNHITQEVLAEIGKNFSSVKGSSELIKERFKLLSQKLEKMDFIAAKNVITSTYAKSLEMGILPNSSYEKGVDLAKQKKYKYGCLPIYNVNDLIYKRAPYLDVAKHITPDDTNKGYTSLEKKTIYHDVQKIYNKKEPYYHLLNEFHKNLQNKDINSIYKIVNKHMDLKVDPTGLKKLAELYTLESKNLLSIQRNIMETFIKKNKTRILDDKNFTNTKLPTKLNHSFER